MTSKLGVYWSVEHRRQSDYAYFKALQPSVFKIMDGGRPDYGFARDYLRNSLVIARDWALSEQHSDMLANPAETGMRHAREWDEHQKQLDFDRDSTLVLGINEPTVWVAGFTEALRVYTIALCDEATRRGLRVGAMQLGVGWPGNNGPDTPPDWSPFSGVQEAILRGNHALVCHEYWADNGPSENWGWWAGRTLKCPWNVPIVIGECGVDMFVKDTGVGQQNRGWLGHMPPERYAAELTEYTNRMSADPRFVGCCVFASDFQAHEWYSFDVEPAYQAILAVKPAGTPPVVTHLPSISTGPEVPVSDNWTRAWPIVLDIEGGLSTDPNDPGNYYDGQLIGTKYGISAASWGGQYDIPNLTKEQALSIYKQSYWDASGADKLPWPMSLVVFDTAVNHGVGVATKLLNDKPTPEEIYLGQRALRYFRDPKWARYGIAWGNRVKRIDDIAEASK